MRKNNELTDEDRRKFRASLPKEARDVVHRDVTESVKRAAYYSEVAAEARAETEMHLATQALRKARGEAATSEELRARNSVLESRLNAIEVESRELREDNNRLRSIPAQAVHS